MRSENKIAFIAGCMDGCHAGHLFILQKMRELVGERGSVLVALNRDTYIVKVKKRPPLFSLEQRKEAVLNTYLVDGVFDFYANPIDLILQYEPDYIFCGDDYKPEAVIGFNEIKRWGGEVVIIPRVPNISTSQIYQNIQNSRSMTQEETNDTEKFLNKEFK